MDYLLQVEDISKSYVNKTILDDINIQIKKGSITVLLGESGSGKTTLSKIIIGLEKSDKGKIYLLGKELPILKRRSFYSCADIQYIFQDPYSSLENSSTIYKTLMEPIRLCKRHKRECLDIEEALNLVGIDSEEYLHRTINSLSGGQRQRVAIARALITRPSLIIGDESTAMLDQTSCSKINEIFNRLKRELNISILIITHNIELLNNFADEIYVLDNGKIVESGETEIVFNSPKSKYLIKLLQNYNMLKRGDLNE